MRLSMRVTIWRAAVSDDGLQSRRGEPQQIGAAWAAQTMVQAGEIDAAGQDAGTMACRFTLRAQGVALTIGAADRVSCDGVWWEIVGIEPVIDRRARSFLARARGAVA